MLWIDALYGKILVNHRVHNLAVLVAMGITHAGTRDVPAVEHMYQESKETYQALFRHLKDCGLQRGWLCVIEDFAILYDDSKSFFFVQLVQYNVSAETGTQRIFQVIDNEGTILGTYTGNMKFLDSEGGKVYFYNFKDNNKPLRITEYHFESEPPTDLN